MADKIQQVRAAVAGGVVLGQPEQPGFIGLPAEVQQRVMADVTAMTLFAEAKNMLWRAANLLVQDVGAWVDQEGNADLSARMEIALKILQNDPTVDFVIQNSGPDAADKPVEMVQK